MDRDTLSEQFNRYLEQLPDSDLATLNESQQSDLHTLFVEVSGLRTEVKSESRLIKSSLDEFTQVFDTLKHSQRRLDDELERNRNALRTQRDDVLRPLFLSLLAIRDRLEATLEGLDAMRPGGWTAMFRKRRSRLIGQIQQGQRITLNHYDDLLASYGVHPINALGQPCDPRSMRVVDTASAPATADGIVVAEVRKGFRWDDQLLRYADVKVNRLQETQH